MTQFCTDPPGPKESELPERAPVGPDEAKRVKGILGLRSVAELQVLDKNNDPYAIGTPTHWDHARWFKAMWDRYGYERDVHTRRVHYRLVSSDDPQLPDGTPYLNDERCDGIMNRAAANARILGLVDPDRFSDRRNEPPVLNLHDRSWRPGPALLWQVPGEEYLQADPSELAWRVPQLRIAGLDSQGFELPTPRADGYDYQHADEPVLCEVWIEKSTQNDVLLPLCRELGVNLVYAKGGQSITNAVLLLLRAKRYHARRVHVLYVVDFDPAGENMPVAVARQAQFWAELLGLDVRVTVSHLTLTAQQVVDLELPRTPIKPGDARKPGFEERHGEGAVELDALEAMYPGGLELLIRNQVDAWRDPNLEQDLADAEAEAQAQIDGLGWPPAELTDERDRIATSVQQTLDRYRPRISKLAQDLARDLAPAQRALDSLRDRTVELATELEDEVGELPERPVPADPTDPENPRVDAYRLLYDSARHWWTQLRVFHTVRGSAERRERKRRVERQRRARKRAEELAADLETDEEEIDAWPTAR